MNNLEKFLSDNNIQIDKEYSIDKHYYKLSLIDNKEYHFYNYYLFCDINIITFKNFHNGEIDKQKEIIDRLSIIFKKHIRLNKLKKINE